MFALYHFLAAAFVLLAKAHAFDVEPPFSAVAQLSGVNTAIEQSRVEVIQSQPEWIELWKEHRQEFHLETPKGEVVNEAGDRPDVDFRKNVVFCLFGGKMHSVLGFEVIDSGDYKNISYLRIQPKVIALSSVSLYQNPYIFVTFPRTTKKVLVQLDEKPIGGPGWRTVATVGPTKK